MEEKEKLFRQTEPRVFSTNADNPEQGRTFVWAWTAWFERMEGDSGAVAFEQIASSERELHEMLLSQNEPEPDELDDEYGKEVLQEFLEQVPLFPEAPEVSSEEAFTEQDPEEDVEHG
jgi:hypothetical protein